MSAQEVADVLRRIRFLAGAEDHHIQRIAEASEIVGYKTGEVLFREGDPTSHVLLLDSGRVALELCAPGVGCRCVLTAGQGEMLGWSAMLEQSTLTATARALEPTRAVRVDSVLLRKACKEDKELGYDVMRRTAQTIGKRLRAARLQLTDVYESNHSKSE